jgi:V-type H+-transporting ATPase subunit F
MAAPEGSLIAMIVDQDTATGLLLTGVGHSDLRKRTNFLIVDDSELCCSHTNAGGSLSRRLALGFWLPPACRTYFRRQSGKVLLFAAETTQSRIEDAFREFTTREDVAVLLINQVIASSIRHLLDAYTKPVPAILEIPSKDSPYDPSQDSVLQRVRFMFGES